MRTVLALVEGTWGGDEWADPSSPFRQMLESDGRFIVVRFRSWSHNLDGIALLTAFIQRGRHKTWLGAGYAFADFVRALTLEYPGLPIAALAHSHAINPVLYGLRVAAEDRRSIYLHRLLSVCSSVRADMQTTAAVAVRHVQQWRHLSSHDGDLAQRMGAWFDDGDLFASRTTWQIPGATNLTNMTIRNIGHAKLLLDAASLHAWIDEGLLDFLAVPRAAA
jgi:hypothetical protein